MKQASSAFCVLNGCPFQGFYLIHLQLAQHVFEWRPIGRNHIGLQTPLAGTGSNGCQFERLPFNQVSNGLPIRTPPVSSVGRLVRHTLRMESHSKQPRQFRNAARRDLFEWAVHSNAFPLIHFEWAAHSNASCFICLRTCAAHTHTHTLRMEAHSKEPRRFRNAARRDLFRMGCPFERLPFDPVSNGLPIRTPSL